MAGNLHHDHARGGERLAKAVWAGIAKRRAPCYKYRVNHAAKDILRAIESWPGEDREELAELAREIEARLTGVYVLSDEERAAIADARRGAFASDEEAKAFWRRHGIR